MTAATISCVETETQDQSQSPSRTFQNVLNDIDGSAANPKEKGTLFEKLVKAFLQTDKTLSQKYDDVWLWSEYPNRRGRPETGIDIVARDRHTAKLTAVQCKFYDPRSTIYERNVTSFIATVAGEAEWDDGVIVAPTDRWSANLEDRLQRQTKSILRWTGATLQESSVDWSRFDLTRPEQIDNLAVKELREHQEQAYQDVINGFNAGNARGKLIMACGTGKTLTGQRIAEHFFAYPPPPENRTCVRFAAFHQPLVSNSERVDEQRQNAH